MSDLVPALPPPPGLQSNFRNPETRCYLTVIPCAAIVGVMILCVFIRMYIKAYVLKLVGWDDLYELGFGVHQWDITYVNLEELMSKEGKTLSALWGPTMFFTKLSLLLLFYRIFSPDRVTKYLVNFGILFIFVLYTTFLLLTFLLCQSVLVQSCASEWTLFVLTTSGLNILNDVYLLMIPLAAIARLQMPSRQKLGVSAIFLTGLLACSSGALALYYRIQLLHTRDITWNFTPIAIFTFMEINTGIIVSCMPTMPALIRDIRSQVSGARGQPPEPQPEPSISHPQPQSRSRTSQPTTMTTTTNHHHTASSTSKSGKSCLKKHSSHDTPQRPQVRFFVGETRRDDDYGEDRRDEEGVSFELDSTPVVRRMEEARVMRREPLRSYFSEDSAEAGPEDWGWLY
ncbi:MAG: hypothetical protein Q9208_001036 [Pyrenodesmia sp. 3 TL-2023]